MAHTKKQEVWLEEYLRTWNATEAARIAGYSNARVEGTRNKKLFADEIAGRIDELTMSADEALVRLAEQARCEYAAYIGNDGTVDLAGLKRDGKMHLVKGIKPTKFGTEVVFHDGQAALVHIGRHHKLFVDRTELSGEIEWKENESAAERIARRLDSIIERIRAQSGAAGTGADGSGTAGA